MKEEIEDLGEQVFCDFCGGDWTNRSESGGLLFQSKAICPTCAPATEKDAKKYGEDDLIRGRCPEGMSFREWVIGLRGGNNTVRTLSFDSPEEMRDFLKARRS